MKNNSFACRSSLMRVLGFVLLGTTALGAADEPLRLWYRQPATVWTEALPVGNGRLGAMVFGGLAEERLQLNEDTVWTGQPHEYHHEGAVKFLPELRRLLWEGKQQEAEELATREFMSIPLRQELYQPVGDLALAFAGHEDASDYHRELDLDAAVATVRYRVGEATFTRETFSSFPDQVIVQRVRADQRGRVSFTARLTSPHENVTTTADGSAGLVLSGRVAKGGLPFAARVRVLTEGGRVTVSDGVVTIADADAATILVTAASAYVSFQDISGDPLARTATPLRAAAMKAFTALREAHVADHRALFRRVALDLGTSEAAARPTDERLTETDKSGDPQLATLLFQFGRYLLIASSRPGAQPANLQGIWNHHLNPPWGSKYTTNINAEMNYWPAEVANLAECHEPFFAMIDDLVLSGRKTAQAHYGARGWVLHHNTDLWRGTAPINASNHGIWPTGGAWVCQHLWERWRFSGDREFLARRAYPVLKEAALFFVDYLVADPKTGRLISGPSNSPEHGGLVMGPTMDHQIIRGLFAWTAEAARELGVDRELAGQLDELRARIAPNQIGRHGQLQEWLEDVDDPHNRHRHVSHLWGVFPGEDITWREPELMRAAQRSLEFRGDGGTGWALGWKISLWARLLDGDHAHRILMNQLNLVRERPDGRTVGGGGTYPNLFDAHPPFQIDGNFAATAGICEMLVQSHGAGSGRQGAGDGKQSAEVGGRKAEVGEIVLLPALPSGWPTGSIRGIRARGGFELDLVWRDGKLARVVVRSQLGRPATLRYGERTTEVRLQAGESGAWGPELAVAAAASVGPDLWSAPSSLGARRVRPGTAH